MGRTRYASSLGTMITTHPKGLNASQSLQKNANVNVVVVQEKKSGSLWVSSSGKHDFMVQYRRIQQTDGHKPKDSKIIRTQWNSVNYKLSFLLARMWAITSTGSRRNGANYSLHTTNSIFCFDTYNDLSRAKFLNCSPRRRRRRTSPLFSPSSSSSSFASLAFQGELIASEPRLLSHGPLVHLILTRWRASDNRTVKCASGWRGWVKKIHTKNSAFGALSFTFCGKEKPRRLRFSSCSW